MEIGRLHEFIVLASQKRLNAAARELHLAPSTLSGHISALENELGGPLFERDDGFTLTSAGEEALEYAQRMLVEYDAMREIFSKTSKTSLLTLRMPNYEFRQKPLLEVRSEFVKYHDGIEIHIVPNEFQTLDPVELLREGRSDVSCLFTLDGYGPSVEELLPDDVAYIHIGTIDCVFFTTTNHELAEKPILNVEDFEGQTILFTLCPLAFNVAKGLTAFMENHGVNIAINYRRANRHDDVFANDIGNNLVFRFKGYGPDERLFSEDMVIHELSFDMKVHAYLIYMPARLDALQLEYMNLVAAHASHGSLV